MTARAPTVALAMIVRDEEAVLARCLDSVMGVVDEMVIVDTGSSDRTKEIIAGFADRVSKLTLLDFEWCDDFSAARNFGLDHVTSDWVLQLDADEELTPGAEAHLTEVIDRTPNSADDSAQVDQAWTTMIYAPSPAHIAVGATSAESIRLFRNRPDIRYTDAIHEGVRVPDVRKVVRSQLTIIHFGPFLDGRKDRFGRNITILERELKKAPADDYLLIKIGIEHHDRGDHSRAIEYFSRTLETVDPSKFFVIRMFRDLALSLHKVNRREEAHDLLEELLEAYAPYTDLVYLAGLFALWEGKNDVARSHFQRCLEMGEPPAGFQTWQGTGSWKAQAELDGLL